MNRETKRLLKRQGQLDGDGQPVMTSRQASSGAALAPKARTPLPQFLREVRAELAKVSWPTRPEVKKFTQVVMFSLVVMTAIVASLDFVIAKAVYLLFNVG
jgi:preprotein translocase subunit SecE